MAITTGTATTDNLNWATAGVTNLGVVGAGCHLVWGWINIATFTAGRCIHPFLKLNGTAELRIVLPRGVGTDDELTTTGAALVVDEWTFVCVASISDSSTGQASRVWIGRADTPPAIVTLGVAVAGSGTYITTTISTLGNSSATGTVAFQGSIDAIGGQRTNSVTVGPDHPFGLSSMTAVVANETQYLYDRWVLPAWQGVPVSPLAEQSGKGGQILLTAAAGPYPVGMSVRQASAAGGNIAATIVGTVATAVRCPRPQGHIDFPYLRR